jgi:hypothetical protein
VAASQRTHRYENVIGVGLDQEPVVAVSRRPSIGVPRIRGWPLFTGGAWARADPLDGISNAAATALRRIAPAVKTTAREFRPLVA